MPTFNDPIADADAVREVVRGLAHATRRIEEPTSIYAVLGSVSCALASLAQSLHQLGDLHDDGAATATRVAGDPHAGRASSYRVSCELHHAAEMLRQVAECVDRAHEIEATITYATSTPDRPCRCPAPNAGLSL